MKLLHTADWHLGKSLREQPLLDDQRHFLHHGFLPAVDEERPDAVLLCGDIYDRAIAPPEAILLFEEILLELCERRGVPTLVITGNHDGADRALPASALLRHSGLYAATKLRDAFSPVVLRDAQGEVHFHLLPYFEPADARDVLGRDDLHTFAHAMGAVTQAIRAGFDPAARHVLLAHCFVTGCRSGDSERALYVGGSGEVARDSFDGFDYAALGHLHAPQRAGGERARYAGSPLKYSFDESGQRKSLTIAELSAGGLSVRERPVKPLHDLRVVAGTLDELAAGLKGDPAPDDYIFAHITGSPVFDQANKLRGIYPNALGLDNVAERTPVERERDELRRLVSNPQPERALFDAFMRQICSQEPTEADFDVFERALRQLAAEEKSR